MKGLGIAVALLVLLAACQQPITTIPTANYTTASTETTAQETHAVTEAAQPEVQKKTTPAPKPATDCKYGEINKDGQCGCASDKKFCREQGKCIDKEDCCIHGNCRAFERCAPTGWRTSICLQAPEKKLCRLLADNDRTELITINNTIFRVGAEDFWANEAVTFQINNQTVKLLANSTVTIDNITFSHSAIDVAGGSCQEDGDD